MELDNEIVSIKNQISILSSKQNELETEKFKKVAKNEELIQEYSMKLMSILNKIDSFDKVKVEDFCITSIMKHLTMVPLHFTYHIVGDDEDVRAAIYYEWDNKPICFIANADKDCCDPDRKYGFVNDNIQEKFLNNYYRYIDEFKYKDLWKTDDSFNTFEGEKVLTKILCSDENEDNIKNFLAECPEEFLLIWIHFRDFFNNVTAINIDEIMEPSTSLSVYKDFLV